MLVNGRIYTRGTVDRVPEGIRGIKEWDRQKSFEGYTLFSQAFDSLIYLMDMNGQIIHRWPVSHNQHGQILQNGNLLADNHGNWIHELEPNGKEVWRWEGKDNLDLYRPYHHDFARVNERYIYVLASRRDQVKEKVYEEELDNPDYMRTDLILEIDRKKDNEVVWSFSFTEHIEELCAESGLDIPIKYTYFYEDIEEDLPAWMKWDDVKMESEEIEKENGKIKRFAPADWAHANTVEVLPKNSSGEKDSRFEEGNILFSLRNLDTIGVIDPEKNEIVWAYGPGILDGQHQPRMLQNGNILLFDNGTYRGYSIVREIDPLREEIVWEYKDKDNFYSPYRAGVQRLPNGNTLITECDAGRIFEVTKEKEIVWDFYTPFIAQAEEHQGRHIFRASRYSEDYIRPVLNSHDENVVCVANEDRKHIEGYNELLEYYQK